LQIAVKPLQIATWLLLTAYRNLQTPYPTVPSPTLYDVPFSHNTYVTDRWTEHRTVSVTVIVRSAKTCRCSGDPDCAAVCRSMRRQDGWQARTGRMPSVATYDGWWATILS